MTATTELDPAREKRIDAIIADLTSRPLRLDRDPALRHPTDLHGTGHTYLWDCAVCRAGDLPEALRALVGAVLDADAAEKRRGTFRMGPGGDRFEFDYLDACSDAPPVRMVGRIVAMTGSLALDTRWATVRTDNGREYEVRMSELRQVVQP